MLAPWKKSYDKLSVLKNRNITLPAVVPIFKAMVSLVIMYRWVRLGHKEGWELKNWCFWTVVLEKTVESPLDCKEIKPVHPKDQSWIFIGRTDAEVEAPILWPPDAKSWITGKDPDAGKDWRQEERGMTEDEMVGWHHQLNRREFEQTLGDGEGQGSLACCSLWGHKESDTTEWLNTTTTKRWLRGTSSARFLRKVQNWDFCGTYMLVTSLNTNNGWGLWGWVYDFWFDSAMLHFCFFSFPPPQPNPKELEHRTWASKILSVTLENKRRLCLNSKVWFNLFKAFNSITA